MIAAHIIHSIYCISYCDFIKGKQAHHRRKEIGILGSHYQAGYEGEVRGNCNCKHMLSGGTFIEPNTTYFQIAIYTLEQK